MGDTSRGMIPSSRRGPRARYRFRFNLRRSRDHTKRINRRAGIDRVNSTSAGGAAESSQRQAALRAAPGSSPKKHNRALKGRKERRQTCRSSDSLVLQFQHLPIFRLRGSLRPFRACRGLSDLIQGAARKAACLWLPSAAPPALVELTRRFALGALHKRKPLRPSTR